MKELVMMFAKVLPEKVIIEKIKELSTQFIITGNETIKNELSMYCHLLLTKELQATMSMEELIKDMDEIQRIRERLNSDKS